MKCSD